MVEVIGVVEGEVLRLMWWLWSVVAWTGVVEGKKRNVEGF